MFVLTCSWKCFGYIPKIIPSGLQTLTREGSKSFSSEGRITLHHLFPTNQERKQNRHESVREYYKHYKESYVKLLLFDPKNTNSSIFDFSPKQTITLVFQLCWYSTLHWRRCTSSLTQQPMTRLKGMSRSTPISWQINKVEDNNVIWTPQGQSRLILFWIMRRDSRLTP